MSELTNQDWGSRTGQKRAGDLALIGSTAPQKTEARVSSLLEQRLVWILCLWNLMQDFCCWPLLDARVYARTQAHERELHETSRLAAIDWTAMSPVTSVQGLLLLRGLRVCVEVVAKPLDSVGYTHRGSENKNSLQRACTQNIQNAGRSTKPRETTDEIIVK